jgi:iron complex outermembrane receptor protein
LFSYTSDLSMYFAGWGSPLGGATPSTTDVSQSSTGVDPKFNLSYEFSKDLMVYATAAKGFRPGGGNQPLPNFPPPNAPANFGYTEWPKTYNSDSLWSYEVGEKSRFLRPSPDRERQRLLRGLDANPAGGTALRLSAVRQRRRCQDLWR